MKFMIAAIVSAAALGLASAAPFESSDSSVAVGQAFVYTTKTAGGKGEKFFKIPSPPNGFYMASYVADFNSLGSTATPVTFACAMIKDGKAFLAHSTTVDTGGFTPGVTGQAPVLVQKGTALEVFCGLAVNQKWTWEFIPLKVTLVKTAGVTTGSLQPTSPPP